MTNKTNQLTSELKEVMFLSEFDSSQEKDLIGLVNDLIKNGVKIKWNKCSVKNKCLRV